MRFTDETYGAKAIAADPAVIERLANLHPAFEKLRNLPLRRRPLAPGHWRIRFCRRDEGEPAPAEAGEVRLHITRIRT